MLKFREIMSTDVVTLRPETTLRDAAALLSRRHVSGAPVVTERGIVGVVSTSDLLSFAASHHGVPTDREFEPAWADLTATPESEPVAVQSPPDAYFTELWASVGEDVEAPLPSLEGPEWSALDEHKVEEVMSRKLYALTPDDAVTVAASLMEKAGIHRVIIAEEGKLVGVVSMSDVANAVAENRIGSGTYVLSRQPERADAAACPDALSNET